MLFEAPLTVKLKGYPPVGVTVKVNHPSILPLVAARSAEYKTGAPMHTEVEGIYVRAS